MSKRKKVLIIDDDYDFVEINKTVLENNGYIVYTAFNGKEGLQLAHDKNPDAITMDVIMNTKSDGFDTARELRKSEQTKNIPILMITSVNETVPFKFLPDETWLPVDMFLEKPVSPEVLMEYVVKLIKN